MISLTAYNLKVDKEWEFYLEIFIKYLAEQYSKDDDFLEIMDYIRGEKYREDILKVTGRKQDTFHLCKIFLDDIFIGFCDYICYKEENGKCSIGNFYLYPEYRNQGYGTKVYRIIEKELMQAGGTYIDLTPSTKAVSFYQRKGFAKTEDIFMENGETAWRKVII